MENEEATSDGVSLYTEHQKGLDIDTEWRPRGSEHSRGDIRTTGEGICITDKIDQTKHSET